MDSTPGTDDARPYGRRAFLLLLAGGVSALAWAAKVNPIASPLTSSFSQLLGNLRYPRRTRLRLDPTG